jgi:hypothetical protein
MAVAPVLHTFDPQMAGKIGLNIDPQGLTAGDQISWYVSSTAGGPYTQAVSTLVHGSGLDALTTVFDVGGSFYCVAKANAAGVWSAYSNEVPAVVSAGPPPPPAPLTQVQHLQAALGGSYSDGDIVEVFPPTPTMSKTVNADGSIS